MKQPQQNPQQLLWELDPQDKPVSPVADEAVVQEMHEEAAASVAPEEDPAPVTDPAVDEDELAEVEAFRQSSDEDGVEIYDGPEPDWLGGDCAKPTEDQPALFLNEPAWAEHWRGMPEFEQRDLRPCQSVTVHFRSEADRQAFSQLVAQTITGKTKSIWYPPAVIGRMVDKRFVDGGAE